jgi:hypothetical protein
VASNNIFKNGLHRLINFQLTRIRRVGLEPQDFVFQSPSLPSLSRSEIVVAMVKTPLLLTLMLVTLSIGSKAQSASAGVRSAQQDLVLSYFHEVHDRGKIDLVDNMFQPDCELHFGSSDVRGIAGVHSMVEGIKTTYSSLTTEVHDIFYEDDWDGILVQIAGRRSWGCVVSDLRL